MLISYNWIKSYVPNLPKPEELMDVFIFHICEVESMKALDNGDFIFDIKVLPDRAHDLLSHRGVARDIAGILGLEYKNISYDVPNGEDTNLFIKIETEKCRRYIGRIVKNIKVSESPLWIVDHLSSMGQRSINNLVDASNIVMFDRGNPIHIFDLDKITGSIIIRQAKEGEKMITLDNKEIVLNPLDTVISDEKNILALAGIKGGKVAEVDGNTKNIVIEVANFDPISVRKTSRRVNIFTDAVKRFENNLSQEIAIEAMNDMSALILEICKESKLEKVIDIYNIKQENKKISFNLDKISKILGLSVSEEDIIKIFTNYKVEYKKEGKDFTIEVPYVRLDLNNAEDVSEEIVRILGYDKLEARLPQITPNPKINKNFHKILFARERLLNDGYSEIMTSSFKDKGEVEVLASASDKKFLRNNLRNGLEESLKLNQINLPLLGIKEVKIFEIGTIFKKDKEEIHIAFGDKNKITEIDLNEFVNESDLSLENYNTLLNTIKNQVKIKLKSWSVYPFIFRDIAIWVKEGENLDILKKLLLDNATDLLVREPYIFDSFTKEGKTSYAFRLVFQSFEKTLKAEEIDEIMAKITNKISENTNWQIR